MPAWIRSWPARAENSSIRAFTSWRVTRSRASMLARSTLSITASWSAITASGRSSPRSCCARMTATQSCRSSTTLRSGDQMSAIGALA